MLVYPCHLSADIFSEWVKSLLLEILSFTYTANGKRQIQVENFSKIKTAKKFLWMKNCVKLLINV